MHTLVYHYGALGDFLTILPVLAAIRRTGNTTITLFGKPSTGQLCGDARQIDSFIDADSGPHRYLFLATTEERAAREFFAPFDAVVIFAAPDGPLVGNACRFSRVVPLHQPPFPENATQHIVDYHLSLLPATTGLHSHTAPVMELPDELHTICRKKYGIDHRPYAVIHPGSGSIKKNWPFDRYLAVAATLRRHGLIVRWLTGPAEPSFDVPLEEHHIAAATLTEATAILAGCSVYIGNDSGMTHLAAASGCPVVAIFGPSDPAVWSPRGSEPVTIIYHPPEDCSPCHRQSEPDPPCTKSCLDAISIDEVTEAALRLVSGRH